MMNTNGRYSAQFHVVRLGPIAMRILSECGQGLVIAVFDRCFYGRIGDDLICVGSASLGMCPLNVITTIPHGGIRLLALEVDMPFRIADGCIKMRTGHLVLTLDGARTWTPEPVDPLAPERLKSGLEALEKATIHRLPEEGLGRFIRPAQEWESTMPATPVLSHAVEPLGRLQAWLRVALANPLAIKRPDILLWQELLGLGPGLTPSGDDLIGGVMLALHNLGQLPLLKAFSVAVAQVVAERTNVISAAHLRGAMEGMGHEAIHRIIAAVLSGEQEKIPQLIEKVKKIGHTSGWDTLAGIVIVFRLWQESRTACQSAA